MSAIFLLLWVVILVGLAGLILQNLSLSISLVFLGLRSPAIPLGFLIVGAIASGIVTGLVIMGLLSLSNRLTRGQFRRIPKAEQPQFRPPWRTWRAKSSNPKTSNPKTTDSQTDYTDSWNSGSNSSDSWDSESGSWDSESYDEPVSQAGNYEVEQKPKTTYQSGSTYSYSYRDDEKTGVGRPESVVEAEYRVITPPYRSDDTDDDYGFDEEDFDDDENFEDDKPDNSRR